ncbi:ribbon-helix-helix domain-containing protein [Jidongwangia harbinensis]|uniref:ribbon-helix-helix domain-containing protein n=1 Tax=Jidongwangia harbinensis TaxID=2878561 RepID=UPI001CD96E34|nr:ribbon-helix-helix domain-containing protein [Jidongwangia harbinensis]MCA2215131.1 ribbon-helix-helix domain-containing protein [Jidongwangia harbinensis]
MTRRITVSLPDDVAEYLDKHPNSSAVVADAVRARMERGAAVAAALRAAGFNITDEGIAAARGKLPKFTEAQRAEAQRFQEALEAGRRPEPR